MLNSYTFSVLLFQKTNHKMCWYKVGIYQKMIAALFWPKRVFGFTQYFINNYLTIRLRARDFYEVIVDEGKIYNKKIDFLTIFRKEITRRMIVSLLATNDE